MFIIIQFFLFGKIYLYLQFPVGKCTNFWLLSHFIKMYCIRKRHMIKGQPIQVRWSILCCIQCKWCSNAIDPVGYFTYFPSISLCTLIRNRFIVNNAYVVLPYYVLLHSFHLQSVEYNSKHIRNLIFLADD